MSDDLDELYQTVLLEHSKRPRNFGEFPEATIHVDADNPSCGDEIHLHADFDPEGKVVKLQFTGQGCAISQASASLMTLKLQGRSGAEALQMLGDFRQLVTQEPGNEPETLGDLVAFGGVRKFPQRVKCAMLPWRAFEQAHDEWQRNSSS